MKKLILRIWESPTFMTWGSFLSKSLGSLIIMLLVLKEFKSAEVALWFLFTTIFNLQNIIDFGFNPTFSRIVSYTNNNKDKMNKFYSKLKLNDIIPTMNKIYNYLATIFFLGMVIFGSIALVKTINQTESMVTSWAAWGIVCLASAINLRGNKYVAFLIGMNQVALVRRWETLFSILRLATQVLFISFELNILLLVIATYVWTILSVLRNRYLSEKIQNGVYKQFKKQEFNKKIFEFMWPSAWRSGLGMGLGTGVLQLSSIVYAQVGTVAEVASFLFALRIMDAIIGFSQAPFYSKIPLLAQKYAINELDYVKIKSKKGMSLSLYIFTFATIMWGLLGSRIMDWINSDTQAMPIFFWLLFSIAHLIHRYGAMHIQLYSITNHIIWHKADGISGVLYLIGIMFTYEALGIYSIIVGMLIGYIGFYAWYAAKHSYRKFNLNFWEYDKHIVANFSLLLIFLVINVVIK